MGKDSKIEWTHHTFNPWIGCEHVSPGCQNCYAEALSKRMGWAKWGPGGDRRRTSAEYWKQPLKWSQEAEVAGERRRVFCASLADWLDSRVESTWLSDLLNLISLTPGLDWLLLTKRPRSWAARLDGAKERSRLAASWLGGLAPSNVWMGVSAESQDMWDERVRELLNNIPARVRFVSAEPLLGPVAMGGLKPDWVIAGGESGRRARPVAKAWVRALREECQERGVAFFFKQWGGPDKRSSGRLLDGRTHDDFPA